VTLRSEAPMATPTMQSAVLRSEASVQPAAPGPRLPRPPPTYLLNRTLIL